MPRFSDLPMDLLPYILIHLSKKEHKALARVCKSLHEEALPSLYRDIAFRATKSRGCALRIAFLLRTLLEKPRLAALVSSFRLLGPHTCWSKYNPWPEDNEAPTVNLWGLEGCSTLSRAQKILVSNQFYQLVDEDMHKSITQFRGRNKDALAMLVLTRCTELNTLEIGDGFLMYSLFLPHILRRAAQLFPKLGHVVLGDRKLDPENSVSYIDLDLIRPIYYVPTVKTFEWTMSQPWQFKWEQPEAPRSTSLTTLHLFRTNIYRATLAELLSNAPNLKHLRYDQEILFRCSLLGNNLAQFTNLEGLNHALHTVHNTLEDMHLSLGLAYGSMSTTQERFRFPPIQGTLMINDMKKLTKVEIPMIMVLGWWPDFAARLEEVLPAGVEDLTLRDDFVNFCPWALGFNCFKKIGLLGEYITGRRTHAPQLRSFKTRLSKPRSNLWLDDAIADMNAPIFGEGVSYNVIQEEGAEIHCWNFSGPSRERTRTV